MQDAIQKKSSTPGASPRTLIGAYFLQGFLLLVALIAYKAGDGSGSGFLDTSMRYVLLLAAVLVVSGIVLILSDWLSGGDMRRMVLALNLSLVSTLLLIAAAEVGLRITMALSPGVASLFPRGFLPKDWRHVATINTALLTDQQRNVASGGAMLHFDEDLGWTVGASKSSVNGLYFSSVEGLRSATPSARFGGRGARRRIALIGDSYTFGLGVTYKDTWGHRLQELVGDEMEVLNFGVAGYGVDQVYLRYMMEARPWAPEIVVFGVILHDLFRSRTVYPFIAYPSWELPFPKPRYRIAGDGVELANVPLAAPATLFETPRIGELPFIELEPGYFAPDWSRRWYHNLYTLRVLISLFPRWPASEAHPAQAVVDLNAGILRMFAESARREGSVPMVVFFPSYGAGQLGAGIASGHGRNAGLMYRTLEHAGVPYLDLTPCLADLSPEEGLAGDGQHYSPKANAMVARCLHAYLQQSNLLQ